MPPSEPWISIGPSLAIERDGSDGDGEFAPARDHRGSHHAKDARTAHKRRDGRVSRNGCEIRQTSSRSPKAIPKAALHKYGEGLPLFGGAAGDS